MLKHQRGSFESSRKIELQPRNKISGGQKLYNFNIFNYIQTNLQNGRRAAILWGAVKLC
jgi:hypothetical protein